MITITRQNDGVLFEFEDSKKYLYGNGSILVPFNTLSIVADESDMITLKKAASNDVFISARYDTDLGYRSKDDAIDDLKDLLFAETGGGSESGITSGEVQTMIDESISGKADTSDVTAVANDVQTVSGQVATKVAITDFNAYSAATDARLAEDEEVTAAALNNLDENKQGKLVYYEENTESKEATITVEDTDFTSTATFNSSTIDLSVESDDSDTHYNGYATVGDAGIQMGYDKSTGSDETDAHSYLNVEDGIIFAEVYADEETTTVEIASTGVTINGDAVATEPYVDAATSGKVNTSAITSSITSSSTNSEVAGAKAVYDAIQAGGGVTVDPTLDTGSTNPVANSAITTAIDAKANKTAAFGGYSFGSTNNVNSLQYKNVNNSSIGSAIYYPKINGKGIFTNSLSFAQNNYNFQLVETSAITSAMTSSSTDAQVPSAKAVYDTLGGLKFVKLTQSEYSAMEQAGTLDSNTLYIVTNVVS